METKSNGKIEPNAEATREAVKMLQAKLGGSLGGFKAAPGTRIVAAAGINVIPVKLSDKTEERYDKQRSVANMQDVPREHLMIRKRHHNANKEAKRLANQQMARANGAGSKKG